MLAPPLPAPNYLIRQGKRFPGDCWERRRSVFAALSEAARNSLRDELVGAASRAGLGAARVKASSPGGKRACLAAVAR